MNSIEIDNLTKVTVIKEFPGLAVGEELVYNKDTKTFEFSETSVDYGEDSESESYASISLSEDIVIRYLGEFFDLLHADVKEDQGVSDDTTEFPLKLEEMEMISKEELYSRMKEIWSIIMELKVKDDTSEIVDHLLNIYWTLESVAGISASKTNLI